MNMLHLWDIEKYGEKKRSEWLTDNEVKELRKQGYICSLAVYWR